jgi:hypothetical protein
LSQEEELAFTMSFDVVHKLLISAVHLQLPDTNKVRHSLSLSLSLFPVLSFSLLSRTYKQTITIFFSTAEEETFFLRIPDQAEAYVPGDLRPDYC